MGRHDSPNWQEKCLMIIEEICANECSMDNHKDGHKCFPCEIYKIAHVGTAQCGHEDWDKEVNELWEQVK